MDANILVARAKDFLLHLFAVTILQFATEQECFVVSFPAVIVIDGCGIQADFSVGGIKLFIAFHDFGDLQQGVIIFRFFGFLHHLGE